jgi:hypothetical protein
LTDVGSGVEDSEDPAVVDDDSEDGEVNEVPSGEPEPAVVGGTTAEVDVEASDEQEEAASATVSAAATKYPRRFNHIPMFYKLTR